MKFAFRAALSLCLLASGVPAVAQQYSGSGASQQPAAYWLLVNASASGTVVRPQGGNYLFHISGTFGGSTVTLTENFGANSQTLGTYTSAPATDPCFAIPQGATVQATISGGAPSGMYATIGGADGGCGVSGGGGSLSGYAQGSTTSGQSGNLTQGATTTSAPTYTTGTTNPISLDTAGNLRVNVVAGGGAGGTSVAQGSTTSGQNVSPMGCRTLTSAPTDTTAQTNMPWCTTKGSQVVAQPTAADLNATVVGTGTFATQLTGATNNINNIAGTVSLPTGAATATNQTNVTGTVAAGTAAANSNLTGCVFNTTEPSPTTGQGLANQCDSKGRQRQVIMDAAGNARGANVSAANALSVDGSAVTQPTSHASGSVASGAYASGSIASGAYSSGSIASGALASGAISNGADVVEGNNTDAAACTSGTSMIACTRQIHADAIAAIPTGPNIIGKVGIDQTTPGTTNAVQAIAGATGGATPFTLTAANSTNATNVKASAGTLYHIAVYNNSATLAWLSFYNTAGTPSCGTSIVYQTMIPANSTSGAGAVEDFSVGLKFSTGIGICVTTGIAGTGAVAASTYAVGLGTN